MSDDRSFVFRTAEFSTMLEKWAAGSKKNTSVVMRQYSKLLVGDVIQVTPPGSETVKGLAAKKQGENTVRNDLARLFKPVRKNSKNAGPLHSAGEMPVIHQRLRNKRGRVPKRVAQHPVSGEDYRAYLQLKLASVGKLAAGWVPAAMRLGTAVPAWIKRHSSPGDVLVEDTADHFLVRATNRVGYVNQQHNLTTNLARALAIRESKMRNALEYQVQQAANKAG